MLARMLFTCVPPFSTFVLESKVANILTLVQVTLICKVTFTRSEGERCHVLLIDTGLLKTM